LGPFFARIRNEACKAALEALRRPLDEIEFEMEAAWSSLIPLQLAGLSMMPMQVWAIFWLERDW
jgi:hypothetical protein